MVLFFASIPLLAWLVLGTSFVSDAIMAPVALFAALRAPTAQAAAWAWRATSAAAAAAGAAAVAGSSPPPLPAASGALASTAMTSAEAAAAALADRHYRLGAVPIATYVELQKQYLEAVEALLDTRTEALEAGHQLELLTGVSLSITSTPAMEEKK